MNITSIQPRNTQNKLPQNKKQGGMADNSPKNYKFLSFTGAASAAQDFAELGQKAVNKAIEITNDTVKKVGNKKVFNKEIVEQLDNIFGNGFFAKQLNKAGITIPQTGEIEIDDFSFIKDDVLHLFPTLKNDFVYGVVKTFKIAPKEGSWMKKALDAREQQKARYWVLNTLGELTSKDEFSQPKYGTMGDFQDFVANKITKVKKGYETRDERTLNRVVTSIVSAIYSGWDFFNISMLEKDDKNDAKQAQKGKIKQDLRRMAWNAGTTFLSLSVFDRITKGNIILNSLVIAGSALMAEVFSRMASGTSLVPLTPEKAAKIAQDKKAGIDKKSKKEQKAENKNTQNNVQFKANLKSNELFKNFAGADGSITALNVQKSQITKQQEIFPEVTTKNEDTKSIKASKILALAFGGATLAYFATKAYKGDYRALKAKKNFIELADADKTVGEYQKCVNGFGKKETLWSKFKSVITTKKVQVKSDELRTKLENLQNAVGDNNKDAYQIIGMYIDEIQAATKEGLISATVEKPITKAFIEGTTKVFKTIYDILTIPAKGLDWLINKTTGNAEIEKQFAEASKNYSKNKKSYSKELVELNNILNNTKWNDKEKAQKIVDRVRNMGPTQETGELANISRTMVTAIGTYFFVNDYRNRVLIESEGKNVEGAAEEAKQRIGHKIANFIINGTLMNIFNSVFKGTVNSSLLGAAAVATTTEITNELLVRKSICQPVLPKESKEDIIRLEQEQLEAKGIWGAWTRMFKKITGKKSLTQKAKITETTQTKAPQMQAHQL